MITRSAAVQWVKNLIGGKGLDYDGQFGFQCVDEVRFYTRLVGADQLPSLGDGGPNNWPGKSTPRGLTKINDPNAGRAGDIAVFKPLAGKKIGHTMILISDVVDGHFTSVDQNWHPVSSTAGSPPIEVYHDNSRVMCYYRPDFEAEPAPAPAPVANNPFRKLPEPMEVVTNKDTNFWFTDFAKYPDARAHSPAPHGTRFTAYGVYKHPLGSTYYMNQVDFGNADTTGKPLNWLGFNSVDLSPYTAPAPEPVVAAPEPQPAPTPAPAPETAQLSRTTVDAARYITKVACKVWNFNATGWSQIATQAVREVPAGTVVTVVEHITNDSLKPAGATYYRLDGDDENTGINKADLEVFVESATAPVMNLPTTPITEVSNPLPTGGESVQVNVTPASPEAWKKTFTDSSKGSYKAVMTITVFDAATSESFDLVFGDQVDVLGSFDKGGKTYYRTSHQGKDEWVAIPQNAIKLMDEDELFSEIAGDISDFGSGMKAAAIKRAGLLDGFIAWIRSLFGNKK